MAEPAAAAPAAKPAPPPTPSGKAPPAFDVRIALAKSLGVPLTARTETPPPAPTKGENVDEPETAAAEDGEPGGEPVGPPGQETEDAPAGDDAAAAEGSADERLEAVSKAFESGDIEAMAKALQKEGGKVSGPVRRAFRAHQRRLQQIETRETKANEREKAFEASRARAQQEIADESRRLSDIQRHASQKFGWAAALERAWDEEDMVGVAKALEKACKGASLATITQRLASGKTAKTPDEQKLADDRKKFADEQAAVERKKTAEGDKQVQAQKREAAVARVGDALKAHPYLQTVDDKGQKVTDTEALAEVFTAYEASWNGEKFTKSARQCADELQDKLLARAKARGLAAPVAPPSSKNGKPVVPAKKPVAKPRLAEPPRSTNAARGTPQDLDASRAMRIANAKRVTEMQRRGVR